MQVRKKYSAQCNSQGTFEDSHLGIKWEIFPLLGIIWDIINPFWDNFGKLSPPKIP